LIKPLSRRSWRGFKGEYLFGFTPFYYPFIPAVKMELTPIEDY
jgi:hypothetical protein